MAEPEQRVASLGAAVLRDAAAEAALMQILTRVAQDPSQARLAFEAIRAMAGEKVVAAVSQAFREQAAETRGVKASVADLEQRVVERFENNERLADQRHQDAEKRADQHHQDLKDLLAQSIAASDQRHQGLKDLLAQSIAASDQRHQGLKDLLAQSIAASDQRHQDAEKRADQRHQDMQRQNDKLDKWLRVLTLGIISMFLAFMASLVVDRLAPGGGRMAAESAARPAAPAPAPGSPGAATPRTGAPEEPAGAAAGTDTRP